MRLYYEHGNIAIFLGNGLEYIQGLPGQSIDMLLTDPPYWTLDEHRKKGTTTRLGGHNDKDKRTGWFNTIDSQELFDLMCQAHRVMTTNRHAYIMGDGQVLKWLLGYAEEAGFSNYKPIVWDKINQGMGYHYRCRHEFFVMLDKGKNRKLSSLSTPDIWSIKRIMRAEVPTEKPVPLMEIPITHSTESGEVVLDPFMGGGSVAIACIKHGRKFIGVEINERHAEIAVRRIEAEQGQGRLL